MQPLRIEWKFTTPLILSDSNPVHLDALLAWAKVDEAIKDEEEAPYSFQEQLPLYRSEGVWQASQLVFEPDSHPFNISMIRQFEGLRIMLGFDTEYTKKAYSKSDYNQGSGPYKGYDMRQRCQWMKKATAWCVGDAEEIRVLLNRVDRIGKLARNGFGRVSSIEIVEDIAANENWLLRVLPEGFERQSGAVPYARIMSPISPPYWDKTRMIEARKPLIDSSELGWI